MHHPLHVYFTKPTSGVTLTGYGMPTLTRSAVSEAKYLKAKILAEAQTRIPGNSLVRFV